MPKVSSVNREQYLQERHDQILDAAIKVFGKKGFAGANVEDIAKEVGIGKGTLYLYFKNKEDIFNSILKERSFIPKLKSLLHNEDKSVQEVLTNVAKEYLGYVPQFFPLLRLAVSEYYRFPEYSYHLFAQVIQSGIDMVADYLQSQVAVGKLHSIENPTFAARAFFGILVTYLISQKLLDNVQYPSESEDEWVKDVVHFFLKGIES